MACTKVLLALYFRRKPATLVTVVSAEEEEESTLPKHEERTTVETSPPCVGSRVEDPKTSAPLDVPYGSMTAMDPTLHNSFPDLSAYTPANIHTMEYIGKRDSLWSVCCVLICLIAPFLADLFFSLTM